MRYTADLAARAQAWLARDAHSTGPDGKRSPEGLLELATVWAAIQNVPLPGCIRQCQFLGRARDVAAYVREYQHLLSSTSAAMSDSQPSTKYQVAPQFAGHSFVHEDYGKAVTADNLTDEDAEFFRSKGRTDAFIERGASPATEGGTAAAPSAPADPETPPKLAAEKEAHGKTKDALKSEKEAHKETKKQLTEVQKQLATAQKELSKVADTASKAADGADASPAADSSSPPEAAH